MPLKENIKNCRLANNFTQQQIADALGIDRTAYANSSSCPNRSSKLFCIPEDYTQPPIFFP